MTGGKVAKQPSSRSVRTAPAPAPAPAPWALQPQPQLQLQLQAAAACVYHTPQPASEHHLTCCSCGGESRCEKKQQQKDAYGSSGYTCNFLERQVSAEVTRSRRFLVTGARLHVQPRRLIPSLPSSPLSLSVSLP